MKPPFCVLQTGFLAWSGRAGVLNRFLRGLAIGTRACWSIAAARRSRCFIEGTDYPRSAPDRRPGRAVRSATGRSLSGVSCAARPSAWSRRSSCHGRHRGACEGRRVGMSAHLHRVAVEISAVGGHMSLLLPCAFRRRPMAIPMPPRAKMPRPAAPTIPKSPHPTASRWFPPLRFHRPASRPGRPSFPPGGGGTGMAVGGRLADRGGGAGAAGAGRCGWKHGGSSTRWCF